MKVDVYTTASKCSTLIWLLVLQTKVQRIEKAQTRAWIPYSSLAQEITYNLAYLTCKTSFQDAFPKDRNFFTQQKSNYIDPSHTAHPLAELSQYPKDYFVSWDVYKHV